MLNKQKGNMYGFVTHTWNVIKGKCPHDCEYCYMKVFPQGELRFDEKELKSFLDGGKLIERDRYIISATKTIRSLTSRLKKRDILEGNKKFKQDLLNSIIELENYLK